MKNQKILSTTLMFIAIVAIIVVFKSIFGEINTLVGVAGLTAALSLLGTDYTINPIKSTIYFVLLEILLGISSYLASSSPFLGFIITFSMIFFILYEFTYNTKKPTYVAFALGYFFMLYTPVNINQLPIRLLSLVFCGLLIMLMQIIVNNKKVYTQAKLSVSNACQSINEQIDFIINDVRNPKRNSINIKTHNIIKSFNMTIYKNLDSNVELTTSLNQSIFICRFLENINIMLEEININAIPKEYELYLNRLKDIVYELSSFVNKNSDLTDLLDSLDNYILKSNEDNLQSYLMYKLEYYISLLKEDLQLTDENLSKKVNNEYSFISISANFTKLRYNISKESLKFTFAFRGALVTSLGVFIVSLLNIPNGKWLVFSLLSIIQPYLESSKSKGKERIIGTVIGLIIFEVLFTIVSDNTLRTFIILITGYISNYQTKYKYQMICTTISSLGAASIGSNINELSLLRISLVLLGTVIALYANKVILPYSMVNSTKKDIKSSIHLNKEIISILYKIGLIKGSFNDELKVAISENIILNSKIDFNNNTLLSKDIDDFLYNQRMFSHKLNFLINNSKNYIDKGLHDFDLFYDIDMTLCKDISPKELINTLNKSRDIYSKLILIDAYELRKNIENSIAISESIYNKI